MSYYVRRWENGLTEVFELPPMEQVIKWGKKTMANCETDGHVYRSMSTKCIFCGYEPTNWVKCETPCAEYAAGVCRCAQFEKQPVSELAAREGE